MKRLRTLWVLVLALVAGFAVQAQRLSGSMTITNLTVTTINGYNADAVLTNSAAGKLDATNGTAVGLALGGTTTYGASDKAYVGDLSEWGAGLGYSLSGDPTLKAVPLSVQTLSALTNNINPLSVNLYGTVQVMGNVSAGDGGGGRFRRIAAASEPVDFGFVFPSSSASWHWSRVDRDVIVPEMFGMIGNEYIGQNLLGIADSRMSTNTYTGTNNWLANAYTVQSVALTGTKLSFTLKAAPAGVQALSLSSSRMRSPGVALTGRYLVKLKARVSSGTGVELFIGKSQVDAGTQMSFTPTGTETTFNGYFTSINTASTIYIGLKSNGAANGSSYEIDDVELYYVGASSTLTSVPAVDSATSYAAEFQRMLNRSLLTQTRIVFRPNRLYRADGGSFTAWDGCDLDLNGSTLYLGDVNAEPGIEFKGYGRIANGRIYSAVSGTGTDKGLIQIGNSQGGQVPLGRNIVEDLYLSHDIAGANFAILALGTHNTEIRNIEFADTSLTRRLIGVVWSGSVSPQLVGTHPAVNSIIENIYAGTSLQNYPTVGGGAVVSVNGMVNTHVRNVHADRVGRSLVTVAPGDYGDTMLQPPFLHTGLFSVLVENCSAYSDSLGYRVSGSQYLSATDYTPMNVVFDNCRTFGNAGSASLDDGFRVEGSVANLTFRNSLVDGHNSGLQVTNVFGDQSGSAVISANLVFENNTVLNSQHDGIRLSGVREMVIRGNRIRSSGLANVTATQSHIHVRTQATNVVIADNLLGRSDEAATTNTFHGVWVDSDSSNKGVSIYNNSFAGTSVTSPVNFGAGAVRGITGPAFAGTALTVPGYPGTPTTGNILVHTNSAWALMSPSASGLGLGTGDSPQFAAVNVGHASDTTLTRASAGVLAVEGAAVITATSVRSGAGSPEGVVTAPVGTLYLRSDGGAGTTFYVKESGTGNTGWAAK